MAVTADAEQVLQIWREVTDESADYVTELQIDWRDVGPQYERFAS